MKNQTLVAVDVSTGSLAHQSKSGDSPIIDGIFGAGFPSLTMMSDNGPSYNPIPQSLYASGLIPSPIFSVHLDNERGSVVLGGIHDGLDKSKIHYTNVVPESNSFKHWTGTVNSISINGEKSFLRESKVFTFDTGTTLTMLPEDVAKPLIQSAWPNAELYHDDGDTTGAGYFRIKDCSKNIPAGNLTLELPSSSSTTFTLSVPLESLLQIISEKEDLCEVTIAAWRVAIIGNRLLANFYTVYEFGDQKRIGFAPV